MRESQILTLLTFKSGTSHTHTHTEYLAVHGDSAHLWAEHLSHSQTTTEPIIHSSVHPSIPAHFPHPSIRLRTTQIIKIFTSELLNCLFGLGEQIVVFLSEQTNHNCYWFTFMQRASLTFPHTIDSFNWAVLRPRSSLI